MFKLVLNLLVRINSHDALIGLIPCLFLFSFITVEFTVLEVWKVFFVSGVMNVRIVSVLLFVIPYEPMKSR